MKYDYYLHRNMNFTANYFGDIGEPLQVSAIRYYIRKFFGYRVTKVPKGTTLRGVIEQTLINTEISLTSYKAKEQFERLLKDKS